MSKETISDTPRTDAMVTGNSSECEDLENFARTLERENTALRAALANVVKEAESYVAIGWDWDNESGDLCDACAAARAALAGMEMP